MLLMLMVFFFVLKQQCESLAINSSSDPAPGRSPGPPDSCQLQGGLKYPTDGLLNLIVFHRLFRTELLVARVEYQIIVKRISQGPVIKFTIESCIDNIPKGKFRSFVESNCHRSNIYKNIFMNASLTLNWTIEDIGDTKKHNLTFKLNYQVDGDPSVYRATYLMSITQDCQLHLKAEEATLTSRDFSHHPNDCQVWFPSHGAGHGLVVKLNRLNVPCQRGHIHFTGLNTTQHLRGHRQTHICGKLEELPDSDRHIYFPFSQTLPVMYLHGNPVFALSYHLVDYCYNVTFVERNGSFELKPSGELHCTFRILLPYGNRISLSLQIGDTTSTGTPTTGSFIDTEKGPQSKCENGLFTQLLDGESTWTHCTKPGDVQRQILIVSRANKVTLKVRVYTNSNRVSGSPLVSLNMSYRAEPIEEIVGFCGFGWVSFQQFCVSAVEEAKLPWHQAEIECSRRGGHLASVRSVRAQNLINEVLQNSPGYRDHNAYWIGASDKIVEGDFRWSDGLSFSYTNWFPGWSQHGHYNRQPNDDGLSEQDCVEVRKIYQLPTSSASLASTFMWNDRDCSMPNYFICERLQNNELLENSYSPDCNRSVELLRQQPKAVVSSPGFPRQYPANADCDTDITAPSGYRIVLDFEELVLENEPSCSYDYLEIFDNNNASITGMNASLARRLCGDWSFKLKLLRYVSKGSKLKLRFSSDYSHHFGGYKARVSMENTLQCSDDRFQLFNNSCYLFIIYPEVTWFTAQQICHGKKTHLASILNAEEERFITTNLRKLNEYRTSSLYWLGAKSDLSAHFAWTDSSSMQYTSWLPGQTPNRTSPNEKCLSLQWTPSPTPMLPSGLYWRAHHCEKIGGFVCKRPKHDLVHGINFNKTIKGLGGNLTTPHFPESYYDRLDFSVRIIGSERSRIVIKFIKIDIELQMNCLYDYVELKSETQLNEASATDAVKFCGIYETNMNRFNFVSKSNVAELKFHSDYSIAGSGFALTWQAVDVSACPLQTLTGKEGKLVSPNYPAFILAYLDCEVTILAPVGKRVWLQFQKYDIQQSIDEITRINIIEVKLGIQLPVLVPFQNKQILTDGSFISDKEHLKIRLQTGSKPSGKGFHATYKIINAASIREEKIINLTTNSSGVVLHLNYPSNPPSNIDYIEHFVAPIGSVISLELFRLKLSERCLNESSVIIIYDNYYDTNGTSWMLCYDAEEAEDAIVPTTPISITSYFNTLHVRQKSGSVMGILLNCSLRVHVDNEFKTKLLKHKEHEVEACTQNPCQNGGKCVSKGRHHFCQCFGYFTGLFCALTKCELEPCLFGTCQLTNNSYKCDCRTGYHGTTCEQKRKPCEGNPCESRGVCVERGDSFQCRCHAWWEGAKCEKRMLNIPYKPLSERMFHEPFWLGLMTVFVVMAVIGLVWCAKRHFPEKIEKLLAEESERNRSTMSSMRSTSVREQLAVASSNNTSTSVTITPSSGPTAPRSLFGRLGIRKPSILSLTSPHASAGYVPATARTFSLDDLLKPPPRSSPSPKKKRNNSTPTKKNAAEKKQILQQLISPANNRQLSRKISLDELIQMSDRKHKEPDLLKTNDLFKETKFTIISNSDNSVQTALSDPKLEKKVTFARLLNKVSAEMSSGSEMELGIMQTNRLGCVFARPSSTPPSPNVDARSPNSTSSNQGSDSFTSSDLAIPTALSSSISNLVVSARARQKPASADSILAMFRNFSASSAGVNLSASLRVSPSTTPTASSPQDDGAGDDESSTSSIHTPVSFSSAASESPVLVPRHQQIEVSVLDTLSAHKASLNGSNFLHPPTILLEIPSTISKCLSPIREMPTPLPSPAITPFMRRSTTSLVGSEVGACDGDEISDDRISVELPNISVSEDDDDLICASDIAFDPQAEDGLILEEAAAMQNTSSLRTKIRLSPLGQPDFPIISITSPLIPLDVPMVTIQTPSPTRHPRPSMLLFPGSPPPRSETTCFPFPPPPKNPNSSRKMFKDFDKPNSLDLPCAPPIITITCNLSEVDSDAESMSPALKAVSHHLNCPSGGMSYLSPFSIGRGEHNASESNLSSSGYSSMASPGPSRCGSSNPLCGSEMEDQGPPGGGLSHRRPSPILKTNPTSRSDCEAIDKSEERKRRGRSDSETLSDDPLLESNDEGIGTDHIDEKIEEGDVRSAKELEVFMKDGDQMLLDLPIPANLQKNEAFISPTVMKTLQLPAIVVQCDSLKMPKLLSPISSRSESPLSDRTTGLGRFSPQFYGRNKDLLPFTDSDGLYDFPSSDKVNLIDGAPPQHKKSGRRREKRTMLRNCKTPSPTKTSNPIGELVFNHLDVPTKDGFYKGPLPRKLSPKRRVTRSQVVSSSSSSDSIVSARELRLSSSSPSPDTIRWSSPVDWVEDKSQAKEQGDAKNDDVHSTMLPPKIVEPPKHQKVSRLRAISHQIRFLRRLELSLKRRERAISPSDSLDSGEDSPRATSPLLQKGVKEEIKKSSSIGKLQPTSSTSKTKNKTKCRKREDLLLPEHRDARSWKKIVTAGNGHSD